MTIRTQNLNDPDRAAFHEKVREATREHSAGADANLDNLLASDKEPLTQERFVFLRTHARDLARNGIAVAPNGELKAAAAPAPAPTRAPAVRNAGEDRESALARIAERNANPLPRHATDGQKIERANAQARDLALVYPHLGESNLEAFDVSLRGGGDAA
jgi:hypothetical protein